MDWNQLAHDRIQPPALVGSYLYSCSVEHTEYVYIDSLGNYQLVTALVIKRRKRRRRGRRRKKDTEKLSKCKDMKIAVSRMCTVRSKIVPIIIGASGTIKKGSDQNRQLVPGH